MGLAKRILGIEMDVGVESSQFTTLTDGRCQITYPYLEEDQIEKLVAGLVDEFGKSCVRVEDDLVILTYTPITFKGLSNETSLG